MAGWTLDPFGDLLLTPAQVQRLGPRARAAWAAEQFRVVVGVLSPYYRCKSRADDALIFAERIAVGGEIDCQTHLNIRASLYSEGLVDALIDEGYPHYLLSATSSLLDAVNGIPLWEQVPADIRSDKPPEVYAADYCVSLVSDLAISFATICVWRQGVQVQIGEDRITPEYFDSLHVPYLSHSLSTLSAAVGVGESDIGRQLFEKFILRWEVPSLPPEVKAQLVGKPPHHEADYLCSV